MKNSVFGKTQENMGNRVQVELKVKDNHLTAFDTKQWLCEDTVHSHLHGHKDTASNPASPAL